MKSNTSKPFSYLIGGIDGSLDASDAEIFKKTADRMKRMGISSVPLHFRLYKRSVDARKKENVKFVYTVLAELDRPLSDAICKKNGVRQLVESEPIHPTGTERMEKPPLVVGMGPAGLFAALLLARNGYEPILIDRGDSVEDRVRTVERFRESGVLDTESNVQFGAGGAGTFSDGKLVTRIHDPYSREVLQTFCQFGAPKELLLLAKPHIGTDVLRGVVSAMIREIERLGGTVLYRCRMDDFSEQSDGTLLVHTSKGEISCGAMILAIGHSSRDTYAKLIEKSYAIEPKPISVGVRAEHLQEDLDRALYGRFAGHPRLGHAEYALSDTKGDRGVYTFCMCPGGEVVAAASEVGGLVVNGMSNHARDGKNANAAVLVSIGCEEYQAVNGSRALGAIEFQRRIERAAFRVGGSDYRAPVMTVGDLLNGKRGTEPSRICPSYRDARVTVADFADVFPSFVISSLQYAIRSFGRSIVGYDAQDAVLTAAETRTSAPLRILRSGETYTALGHSLVYPCGEGAGYAGGITSAAVDGLHVAEAIMHRFAPLH